MLVTFSVIVSTDRYFISFVFKRKKNVKQYFT